jgi:uncharacterized protein
MNVRIDGKNAETQLFEALEALAQKNVEPWIQMFHEDGVIEFPFAPAGFPQRVEGKSAIAAYMRPFPDTFSIDKVVKVDVHHCGETMMVAEFRCEGRAVKTGNRYNQSYVGVVSHVDGKVKKYRDYFNPIVAIESLGGVGAFNKFAERSA